MMSAYETLTTVSFCRNLPESIIHHLVSLCWTVRRPAGANIQYVGEPLYAVYILADGRVRVSRSAGNGRELVLNIAGSGAHFNLGPVFDGGACTLNLDAVTDTTLLMLPAAELLEIIEREPRLLREVTRELALHERTVIELLESVTLRSLPARLAGLLLGDALRSLDGHSPLPLTQEEMAARLGTVREMIGRTLRDFAQRGLIRLERRRIVIVDSAGLERERDH